jgi:hypothetical protein
MLQIIWVSAFCGAILSGSAKIYEINLSADASWR